MPSPIIGRVIFRCPFGHFPAPFLPLSSPGTEACRSRGVRNHATNPNWTLRLARSRRVVPLVDFFFGPLPLLLTSPYFVLILFCHFPPVFRIFRTSYSPRQPVLSLFFLSFLFISEAVRSVHFHALDLQAQMGLLCLFHLILLPRILVVCVPLIFFVFMFLFLSLALQRSPLSFAPAFSNGHH